MILKAVLAGLGLTCLPEDLVQENIARGELIRVLGEWCRPFCRLSSLLPQPPPYHPPAFAAVIEALRHNRRKTESTGAR